MTLTEHQKSAQQRAHVVTHTNHYRTVWSRKVGDNGLMDKLYTTC